MIDLSVIYLTSKFKNIQLCFYQTPTYLNTMQAQSIIYEKCNDSHNTLEFRLQNSNDKLCRNPGIQK